MFDFLKRKQSSDSPKSVTLPFKSGEAAFEYCCRFMSCEVREDIGLPALVLDGRKEFGTSEAVSVDAKGMQLAALKVPSDDGGFLVMANALSSKGPLLVPGQLVLWRAITYSREVGDGIASAGGDKRSGRVGIIMATLESTWKGGVWVLDKKFLRE